MLLPFYDINSIEAGCDEAGRGCLAGPVFAAAVILPVDFNNVLLNDSKQLTAKQRIFLRGVIERGSGLGSGCGDSSGNRQDKYSLGFFSSHAQSFGPAKIASGEPANRR